VQSACLSVAKGRCKTVESQQTNARRELQGDTGRGEGEGGESTWAVRGAMDEEAMTKQ